MRSADRRRLARMTTAPDGSCRICGRGPRPGERALTRSELGERLLLGVRVAERLIRHVSDAEQLQRAVVDGEALASAARRQLDELARRAG